MRLALLSLAVFTGLAGSAAAMQRCVKGADIREFEVRTPGVVGSACDLAYRRGGEASTPWHANNSPGYCAKRAAALVADLIAAGYDCALADAEGEASPKEEASYTEQGTNSAPRGALSALREWDPPAAYDDEAPIVTFEEEADPAPPPATAGEGALTKALPFPPGRSELAEALALEGGEARPAGAAPSVPAPPVNAGPAALSTTPVSATADAEGPSALGRLVGAELEGRLAPPSFSAPAEAGKARLASAAPVAAGAALAARAPEDLIKAVLAAQVAAWNEGDLDGFMRGYWRSPDLTVINGAAVLKGWNETMKRYREKYGEGAALGRLSFEKLDVRLLDDEVAVIVGRFNLARGEAANMGAFTLV
ncbi:MAG: hypothetical protein AB7P23_13380, partial [Amphiplicatus sp.]